MANQFVGRLLGFKGEDEYFDEAEVLVELTEVNGPEIELAFDLPTPGKPRLYLNVSLVEVMAKALGEKK